MFYGDKMASEIDFWLTGLFKTLNPDLNLPKIA